MFQIQIKPIDLITILEQSYVKSNIERSLISIGNGKISTKSVNQQKSLISYVEFEGGFDTNAIDITDTKFGVMNIGSIIKYINHLDNNVDKITCSIGDGFVELSFLKMKYKFPMLAESIIPHIPNFEGLKINKMLDIHLDKTQIKELVKGIDNIQMKRCTIKVEDGSLYFVVGDDKLDNFAFQVMENIEIAIPGKIFDADKLSDVIKANDYMIDISIADKALIIHGLGPIKSSYVMSYLME